MMNDRQLDIPAGWAWATIDDVTEETIEQRAPGNGTKFLYVDISSINNKTKKITNPKKLLVAEAPSRAKQRLLPGDVLVSMTRPNLNAVALVPESMVGAIGSTGFHVLRTKWILPSWLFYLVQTNSFVEAISELVQGALYPAIRPKDIRAYRIPVAPFNEQRRIVDELEKQLTRLDSAIADIKRVQANLSRYRAVVIDAACRGQLVPNEATFAKENALIYEPANLSLTRLLNERRAKWEADQLAKMQEKSKSPKNDQWKAKYPEPVAPNIDGLPEIPQGWIWATVDQLAALEPNSITDGPFGSNLKTSHYTESGPRVIRLQNIGDGEFIDVEAHISVEHFKTLRKHQVEAGDLVVAALGERPPRACIIPES
jgi:type I restriction enzyme S subunit